VFVSSTRTRIIELSKAGLSQLAIARELGLAGNTVAYHLARSDRSEKIPPTSSCESGPCEPSQKAVSVIATRDRVRAMLADGLTHVETARALGISKATVTYHARRLGAAIDDRCARRYDWAAVQRYYDAGHGVRQCIAAFGFSSASWFDAVNRGDLIARPASVPDDAFYAKDTHRGRFNVKTRLIRDGLKARRCEICGLQDWRGAPITLALHHINGMRDDNRLANLQLLCPNCHSQTENFAGRNRRPRDRPVDAET
jgi:DNA-binding CsgD family transcriptional regulator/5-methylcytosine-specific restriction endonuclease McrA